MKEKGTETENSISRKGEVSDCLQHQERCWAMRASRSDAGLLEKITSYYSSNCTVTTVLHKYYFSIK